MKDAGGIMPALADDAEVRRREVAGIDAIEWIVVALGDDAIVSGKTNDAHASAETLAPEDPPRFSTLCSTLAERPRPTATLIAHPERQADGIPPSTEITVSRIYDKQMTRA
jgi:hypothetical protein